MQYFALVVPCVLFLQTITVSRYMHSRKFLEPAKTGACLNVQSFYSAAGTASFFSTYALRGEEQHCHKRLYFETTVVLAIEEESVRNHGGLHEVCRERKR